MSTTVPPDHAIVATLRAAGCVFAEDEARLLTAAATDPDHLTNLVDRRAAGHPLEHLLGWAQFHDRRIAVDPGVFVPRRRTEFLATQAIAAAAPGAVVVDLCCGSGAVAATLTATVPNLDLHAVDIDPAAVACARRNLPDAAVYQGDLYQPLPARLRGHVTVLVANVPYVPTDAIALMPPEARLYEPRTALDGGPDGLDLLRRVAADAGSWLARGGRLLVETSHRQADAAVTVLTNHGLHAHAVHDDDLGATVVRARPDPA